MQEASATANGGSAWEWLVGGGLAILSAFIALVKWFVGNQVEVALARHNIDEKAHPTLESVSAIAEKVDGVERKLDAHNVSLFGKLQEIAESQGRILGRLESIEDCGRCRFRDEVR